jgi:hypothetical protein
VIEKGPERRRELPPHFQCALPHRPLKERVLLWLMLVWGIAAYAGGGGGGAGAGAEGGGEGQAVAPGVVFQRVEEEAQEVKVR